MGKIKGWIFAPPLPIELQFRSKYIAIRNTAS